MIEKTGVIEIGDGKNMGHGTSDKLMFSLLWGMGYLWN